MKAIKTNGKIKVYTKLPKNWKNFSGFENASKELLEQEGFFDVVEPVYDQELQRLGEIYFDETKKVFTYPVIQRDFGSLEDIKNRLYRDLKELILEISQIVSAVKNIYDPMRIDNNAIPEDFKTLVSQITGVRNRVINDIEGFTTVEDTIGYKIRTQEASDFIDVLKSYL